MNETLAICLLLFTSGSVAAASPSISKGELEELQGVSAAILERCPPAECVVIGIGRSPALFTADLKNQVDGYAFNVPISQFRHNPDIKKMLPLSRTEVHLASGFEPLSPQQELQFREHLARFMPTAEQFRGKRLLLIDYSSNGGFSLFSFRRYLGRYFESLGLDTAIGSLSICGPGESRKVVATAPRYGFTDFDYFELKKARGLAHSLQGAKFDDLAEYPEYLLEADSTVIRRNSAYDQLRSKLLQFESRLSRPALMDSCLRRAFRILKLLRSPP